MGYSLQFYGAAWSILEGKFGRPHVIIDAQLESSQSMSGETSRLKQIGDFWSKLTLYLAVDKLSQVPKEKFWFYVDSKDEDSPDLLMFEKKTLSSTTFVYKGFSRDSDKKKTQKSTNIDKRFSKTSNFSASSNVKDPKQMQRNHCPLADGTHEIWNCPLFKNISVNDR